MKFLKLTYVDHKTLVPITKEPAKNGPEIPNGVSIVFDIQSERGNPAPPLFGVASDDYCVEDWMEEIPEDLFFIALENELLARADNTYHNFFRCGFNFNDKIIINEDIIMKIIRIHAGMLVNESCDKFCFMYYGNWVELSRNEVAKIIEMYTIYSQNCEYWLREITEKIISTNITMNSVNELSEIYVELENYPSFRGLS